VSHCHYVKQIECVINDIIKIQEKNEEKKGKILWTFLTLFDPSLIYWLHCGNNCCCILVYL